MRKGAISIHALRGEGDVKSVNGEKALLKISIHALRGEGDATFADFLISRFLFQSTPSVGRATVVLVLVNFVDRAISIHALRGEGDV